VQFNVKKKLQILIFLFLSVNSGYAQSLYNEKWFQKSNEDLSEINISNSHQSDINHCIIEILKAQEKYSIPNNILLAIGIQESGRKRDGVLTSWPWTVNSYGVGRYFNNKKDAIDWVIKRKNEGINSNDVGCMQINLKWHPDAFNNLEQAFDPKINVQYAAKFLRQLHKKTGNWMEAAGSYHSFTPSKKKIYLDKLKQNLNVAKNAEAYFLKVSSYQSSENIKSNEKKSGYNSHIGWNSWKNDLSSASIYANKDITPILPNYIKE
jgi:hypothetical protein